MATQLGLSANFLKTLSDKELLELLRTTGGRDKEKVIAERRRRKNQN